MMFYDYIIKRCKRIANSKECTELETDSSPEKKIIPPRVRDNSIFGSPYQEEFKSIRVDSAIARPKRKPSGWGRASSYKDDDDDVDDDPINLWQSKDKDVYAINLNPSKKIKSTRKKKRNSSLKYFIFIPSVGNKKQKVIQRPKLVSTEEITTRKPERLVLNDIQLPKDTVEKIPTEPKYTMVKNNPPMKELEKPQEKLEEKEPEEKKERKIKRPKEPKERDTTIKPKKERKSKEPKKEKPQKKEKRGSFQESLRSETTVIQDSRTSYLSVSVGGDDEPSPRGKTFGMGNEWPGLTDNDNKIIKPCIAFDQQQQRLDE